MAVDVPVAGAGRLGDHRELREVDRVFAATGAGQPAGRGRAQGGRRRSGGRGAVWNSSRRKIRRCWGIRQRRTRGGAGSAPLFSSAVHAGDAVGRTDRAAGHGGGCNFAGHPVSETRGGGAEAVWAATFAAPARIGERRAKIRTGRRGRLRGERRDRRPACAGSTMGGEVAPQAALCGQY